MKELSLVGIGLLLGAGLGLTLAVRFIIKNFPRWPG